MSFETIYIDIRDHCAYITLSKPDRLNAFDMKLGEELSEVLTSISHDDNIKVVVIKGLGKGFCGGGDVKEMHLAEDKPKFLLELTRVICRCVSIIRGMEKPVIAAVNGAAFGAGFSLALACDIIVAVREARFSSAFIGIGLAPGCGTKLLTQIVSYQRACEYILTSKVLTAEDGFKLGFVNKIVDSDRLDEEVEFFVDKFRKSPSIAVGKAKMLINKSYENDMLDHFKLENETASYTAGTKDFSEGVKAFVEKRKPIFKGE